MFCADAETTHPRAAIMYGRARPVRYSRTIVKRRSDHFTLLITQNPLTALDRQVKKSKRSPYSITERRVPELIPVLGSQPAGDVSH